MIKVSVLIPVYNVEKYLPACLDSLSKQTLKGIEFICLNDGSTDGSSKLLHAYAASDSRFRIIEKNNTGYGDTLNLGLSQAKGKYIGIVEPDDFVDAEMFQTLYDLAELFQADLVRENYFFHFNQEDKLHQLISMPRIPQAIDLKTHSNLLLEPPAIWSALYRVKFLKEHQCHFLPTPGASFQDTSFNFKTLLAAHKIVLSPTQHYHYRQDNANSSVRSLEKIFAVSNEYHEAELYLKTLSPAKQKHYAPYLLAAKYGAYHWNLLRLPSSAVKKFLPTMRQEFLAAKNQNLLKKSAFPQKWWFSLQLLLRSQSLFLASLHLYKILKHSRKNY